MNFTGLQKTQADPAKLALVKTWIYEVMQLDADTALSISQLICKEPNCPSIETVVGVMTNPMKQYKIHKAIADIERSDIANLVLPK
jgi:hypothetical protein